MGTVAPCGSPKFATDNQCDDNNNKESCNWDGGACCGGKTKFCKKCECLDPNHQVAACEKPKYQGDKQCDDENNVESCDYDGGDCCGTKVGTKFCTECACLDPSYVPPTTPAPTCGNEAWKGDGNCDDVNNNKGCEYDGGDCCEGTSKGGKVRTKFCAKCECLDPDQLNICEGECGGVKYQGDGFCDDYNNNCGCEYDGGDCCEATANKNKVKKAYCTACECLDPENQWRKFYRLGLRCIKFCFCLLNYVSFSFLQTM